MYMFCRYGLAYVLHRLLAVANIIMTSVYLHFTQQIMASHDRANKQAEMDVSPAMGFNYGLTVISLRRVPYGGPIAGARILKCSLL